MRLMSGEIRVCNKGQAIEAAPVGGLLVRVCEPGYSESGSLARNRRGEPVKSMWVSTALYGYWQDAGAGRSKHEDRAARVF
jgi:hypothetical protein